MGGIGIPISQMTNRQLIMAMPLFFVVSGGNICLFAGAFALEWSGSGRFRPLVSYALVIAFFAAFLVYWEIVFVRELLRGRAGSDHAGRANG